MFVRRLACRLFWSAVLLPALAVLGQAAPNSNPVYRQLRTLTPEGAPIAVEGITLKRGNATFTFHTGSFTFFPAVNGHITGAVFHGSGTLHLTPDTPDESRFAVTMNKQPEWDETFESVVLRFTDASAAEIKAVARSTQPAAAYNDSGASRDFNEAFRTDLKYNIHARLLADVLSPAPVGGFFSAFFHGKPWGKNLFFLFDPYGVNEVRPQQGELLSWSDGEATILNAFGSTVEDTSSYSVPSEDIDVNIANNGFLSAQAKVTVQSTHDGLVVVPLDLFPSMRVSSVHDSNGALLDFIQESKDYDSGFSLILAAPLMRSESTVVTIAYAGKDVIRNEGGDNYTVVGNARENWYPAHYFGAYASYHMTFHVPKELNLVATGNLLNTRNDGKLTTTTWDSGVPIPVAGFNLGAFDVVEAQLPGLKISSYANQSDAFTDPKLQTTGLNKRALAEGQVAASIYTKLFGPLPYDHIALTQQTACNYGQSWPMLVFLPICSYWDTTVQHELGILEADPTYWHVVTPHEVAHQWWGHTVSFGSYRDQWMSEGFADLSASIFLQATRSHKEYLDFWKVARDRLTVRNNYGYRPIDVGPVTMGYRLDTQKTGNIAQSLIYPKGAYILQMLRMMEYSNQTHDGVFHNMMADFLTSFSNRTATTEDFKAIAEKHMTPEMDIDNNHRLDWFFNEYVYGTALPTYTFTSTLKPGANGATSSHFRLEQAGVDNSFVMLVPIYIELADGRTLKAALLNMRGNKTEEQDFDIPNLGSPVKRLLINYNDDVLSIEK